MKRLARAILASCPLPLASNFSAWQPGAGVEGFDDARKATRIEKSEQSSPSTEINIGYPETERVRGREPVLEAGEHRAVRHNTRRRSLNHYDSREPSGRLEGHSRFEFPTLPSILFPTGFKGRPVVLCGILCPFVCLCDPLFFPGDHLLCSTTDSFFRGRYVTVLLHFPQPLIFAA